MSAIELIARRRPAARSARVSVAAPLALENGDRLTAHEFLRRYEAMPEAKKAQLIEGIVYMASPVRADTHGEPDGLIQGWLFTYALEHAKLKLFTNTTLLLDDDNTPQPDAVLCMAPMANGHVWMNKKGYLCGKPELVCEVASSSASVDMNAKFNAYRRNGVQEYLVWLVREQRVAWFKLGMNGYELIRETGGKIKSTVFPGLILDVKALLKGDKKKLVAALKAKR
jgi:Uma2 family endonuclease